MNATHTYLPPTQYFHGHLGQCFVVASRLWELDCFGIKNVNKHLKHTFHFYYFHLFFISSLLFLILFHSHTMCSVAAPNALFSRWSEYLELSNSKRQAPFGSIRKRHNAIHGRENNILSSQFTVVCATVHIMMLPEESERGLPLWTWHCQHIIP